MVIVRMLSGVIDILTPAVVMLRRCFSLSLRWQGSIPVIMASDTLVGVANIADPGIP